MPKLPSIGETIPKVKASIPELGKFLLLALGWIIGRILHVEVDRNFGQQAPLFSMNALLDSTKQYHLSLSDLISFGLLAVIAWLLYRWGKFLKWFGAGLFLYIVTFELYELLYGEVLTGVAPIPPSGEGGV